MLNLKNLWSSDQPTSSDYIRSFKSLLNGVAVQPEELNSPELPVLRDEILAVAGKLSPQTTNKELDSTVTAVAASVRKFLTGSAARFAGHLNELKLTLRALTQTVTFLAESRSSVVHQLTFIERQLEQASELEDIRLLRPKLMNCLELVREETARLHSESAVNSELVRSGLGAAPQFAETPRRVGTLDPVTGLPGRMVAQRLIEDKIAAGKECVIALFLPDRLESINRHHGRAAGDEVLLSVAQYLAQNILPPSSLCRWSGPAFLALAESPLKNSQISRAWNAIASKTIELNINLERRTVMVTVSNTCIVQTTDGSTDAAKLFSELDLAVAAHR